VTSLTNEPSRLLEAPPPEPDVAERHRRKRVGLTTNWPLVWAARCRRTLPRHVTLRQSGSARSERPVMVAMVDAPVKRCITLPQCVQECAGVRGVLGQAYVCGAGQAHSCLVDCGITQPHSGASAERRARAVGCSGPFCLRAASSSPCASAACASAACESATCASAAPLRSVRELARTRAPTGPTLCRAQAGRALAAVRERRGGQQGRLKPRADAVRKR